jgi:hypothetical protein
MSVVASLPENLRFAGLLVLLGTGRIGVATIQFGGIAPRSESHRSRA